MDEKDKKIQKLEDLVNKLLARIEELERMLGLNSSNSSKPPSSDGFRKQPKPTSLRLKGQKPSGGQKGHKGHTLTQVETPTAIVTHYVKQCGACDKSLKAQKPMHVVKRQVFDIPEPKIEVTEHQAEVKVCKCGHTTVASFPAGVTGPVQYGIRVKTLATYLSNQQLIPEDRLQETFLDIFGLPISTATLAKINNDMGTILEKHQEQVFEQLKHEPSKHFDESGFRIAAKTNWLHVISTPTLTHYRVSAKRKDLPEGFKGIGVHDHWKPYFQMEGMEHALCNAHHLRELKSLEEIEKEPWAFQMSRFLRLLSRLTDPPLERVFKLYDQIVARGLAFHEHQTSMGGRKKRIGHNLLLRLKNFKDAVLRFLTNPGVPFTNNQAEQDIRMMKVKQKISGGFRGMDGAKTFCTIRGFISTKRKQSHNIFQALQLQITT